MKKHYVIGIELGSTRIKSVLIDGNATVVAQGAYEWENVLTDGYWSYPLEQVTEGVQKSYADLNQNYRNIFGENLTQVEAIGISAMMHGYLAFDGNWDLLVPFRTWRNTNTGTAAKPLSGLFRFNVPQRWSVAHYYQAILNGEEHVTDVAHLTTLAGYVHYKLTGENVLGIGDASGMFPIRNGEYDPEKLEKFNALTGTDLAALLPEIRPAGASGGILTEAGAKWLDPTGNLKSGILLCPPEGDAGTGMIATNSITPRTANISAGTSGFLMAVLEREFRSYYEEIDIVATPAGAPVAMIHVNNFTSEITAWTNLFEEVVALSGDTLGRGELFDALYKKSAEGDTDCGGLLGYNFLSGEPIAGTERGIPLLIRRPEGKLTLANFMKMQIYSALGTLAIGMDFLSQESVQIDSVCGHGGFFKTERVGQKAMSAAIGAPVTVMKNAGEGGAWGIALLALYTAAGEGTLEEFLDGFFRNTEKTTLSADERETVDFARFMECYKTGLSLEKYAAERL